MAQKIQTLQTGSNGKQLIFNHYQAGERKKKLFLKREKFAKS